MTNDTSNVFKLAALQDSDTELIEELAGLSALDYARRRKEAAKELNVGVAALDKVVKKERKRLGLDEDRSSPPFPSVEPATHRVLAAGLLQRLAARLKQHVVFPEEAANAVALWVAFAWTHDAATHSPILLVTSAERDSGKTTLLGLVNFVSPRGLMLVDPSPAVLYRLIEKWKPTLVVDEADDQFKENPPLRAVVNSGWTRGAGVPRCDPDTNEPEIFSTFGPKAIGMKGSSIPDTTFSRSIVIEMVRKKPGERTADFEHLDDAGLKGLRRELARWAADNVDALAGTRPTMPDGFQNRLAANWRPLLAVADLAGGDWPRLARAAAVALAPKGTSSDGTTLLGDFRSIFANEKADRLPSSVIAEKLHGLEDRPWAEWGRNEKPISPNQIAWLLRPFGIAPETIATGGRRPKGYLLVRLQESFERYLDAPGVSESLNRNSPTAAGTSTTFQTATEDVQVAVQKCEKPLWPSGSCGWAVQKGGNGQERKENGQAEEPLPPVCAHCGNPENPDTPVLTYELNGESYLLHENCHAEWLAGPDPDDWTFNSDDAPEVGR